VKDSRVTPAALALYSDASQDYFHGQKDVPDEDGNSPRPHFRASMLGRCMVAHLTWRAGVPSPRVIDAASRARMDAGNTYEDGVRVRLDRMGLLLGKQIALSDDELDVTGTIDLMWGGEVQEVPWWWQTYRDAMWVDFLRFLRGRVLERGPFPVTIAEVKTTGGYGFRNADKDGRWDHQLQLGAYRLLAERHPEELPGPLPDRYEILLINRDNGAHRDIPLLKERVDEAVDRLGLLREAWTTGKWPECTCETSIEKLGWLESKYCQYPNADGDGCCGTNLLARLEQSVERTRDRKDGQLSLEGGTDATHATA
jgi:hypothetical protein